MSCSKLPTFLWGEVIKIENYMLNRVPSKSVPKTPFELWTNKKPMLNHLRIWRCTSEVRAYNPMEKKLDPRIISCFFLGYPEKTKGYRFYCPNHTSRFIETRRAKSLKKLMMINGKIILTGMKIPQHCNMET